MSDLIKEVEVGGVTYVVQPIDAQTQYKILQKLSRYGVAHLVSGMIKAETEKNKAGAMKLAYTQALLAIIQNMPEAEQDFCITNALKKTAVAGETEAVGISMFTGRIAEYVLLGAKAIGVQLGDFSCFQSLINESMA